MSGGGPALYRRLRHRLRSLIGRSRLLFPLFRIRHRPFARLVEPGTDLLIEGYPRSGNTFALVAFELAQTEPLRTAHHLHAPAHVLSAVRRRIPALVLIREPLDAAASLLVRQPAIGAEQALRDYFRFYEPLEAVRRDLVIARFADVTTDFGGVLGRVNRRFATRFELFEHSAGNVAECFRRIEERDRLGQRRHTVTETHVARPSGERQASRRRARAELDSGRHAELADRARAIYRRLSGPCEDPAE